MTTEDTTTRGRGSPKVQVAGFRCKALQHRDLSLFDPSERSQLDEPSQGTVLKELA